jgi:hypothetical protein
MEDYEAQLKKANTHLRQDLRVPQPVFRFYRCFQSLAYLQVFTRDSTAICRVYCTHDEVYYMRCYNSSVPCVHVIKENKETKTLGIGTDDWCHRKHR